MNKNLILVVALSSLTVACGEPFITFDGDAGPSNECCTTKGPGETPADAKPTDVTPSEDGGTDSPTGCCDSGKTDSGSDADAGSTPDSSNDSGTPDGGNDAEPDSGTFPDAGSCTTNATTCAGNRPLICSNNAWTSNGGVCNYGCSVGACSCTAPVGRFVNGPAGVVKDTSTGLSWFVWTAGWTDGGAPTPITYNSAESICSAFDMRLPTKDELVSIVAEVAPNTFCGPVDVDPVFQTKFKMSGDWYWTSTPAPGHPSDRMVVNFANGTVERGFIATGSSGVQMHICVAQ